MSFNTTFTSAHGRFLISTNCFVLYVIIYKLFCTWIMNWKLGLLLLLWYTSPGFVFSTTKMHTWKMSWRTNSNSKLNLYNTNMCRFVLFCASCVECIVIECWNPGPLGNFNIWSYLMNATDDGGKHNVSYYSIKHSRSEMDVYYITEWF